jgi:hypothetical protein
MSRYFVSFLLMILAVNAIASASLFVEAPPYEFILAISGTQGNDISTITVGSGEHGVQWSINGIDCTEVKYDQQKKLIELRYEPRKQSGGPPPFHLVIKGNEGTLTVSGKRYKATCDWQI